jgi:antitoxin component YwqK of YwqJK toxin-antitoxin module
MKCIIIFGIICLNCIGSAHAQETYSRDVIITTDTTREFNNTRKFGSITDTYIENGIEVRVFETPFQVAHILSKKKDNLNGLYIEFYLPSNMPKVKGSYHENDKNGEWFYWNEKGVLIKKEIWRKGKLVKSIKIGNK